MRLKIGNIKTMNKNYTEIFYEFIDNDSIINDLPRHEYHSLFMAIILRALLDVTKPKNIKETNRIKVDRRSAKAWFFATSGVTCENFETICDGAGIQPMVMRSITKQILNKKDIKNVRKRINSFFTNE